ncbi:MAG TPA: sulfurtransferase TusA family protein [Nitrospiria bacterium]|jgi:tRNA 2-thiouridine synthesizing protein A|nr:sulfurtransferase TusA family protein [Nitrospiria bacterium]
MDKNQEQNAAAEIDLRGVICPYNYVKTKLKLEEMSLGQVLAVILDEGEAMQNVPRSVQDEGHTIIQQERYQSGYRIFIRKTV